MLSAALAHLYPGLGTVPGHQGTTAGIATGDAQPASGLASECELQSQMTWERDEPEVAGQEKSLSQPNANVILFCREAQKDPYVFMGRYASCQCLSCNPFISNVLQLIWNHVALTTDHLRAIFSTRSAILLLPLIKFSRLVAEKLDRTSSTFQVTWRLVDYDQLLAAPRFRRILTTAETVALCRNSTSGI